MDISKEYINQCDCPEIQEQWKPSEGDNFSFINEPKIIKDYEIWALEKRELSDIEEWNEIIKTMGTHFVDHFIEARDCFVWLPRQEQIQEMIREYYAQEMGSKRPHDKWFPEGDIGLGYVFRKFTVFTTANPLTLESAKSFEQLWLTFYIYEKHGKIWDGEKWVEEKKEE